MNSTPTIPPMKSVIFEELDPIPAISFALVVAVDVERTEMLSRFAPLDGHNEVLKVAAPEGTYYLGKCGNYPCVLVTCEPGSVGRDGSALTIADAIATWRPYGVLLVGIAFGKDRKKQLIGDVLVSTQVIPYEYQRVSKDSVIPRHPRPEASGLLRDRIRHLNWTWTPEGKESRQPLRVPILSGDKLVDNAEFKALLFARYPDAGGGEMEGAGLYAAADRRRLPWIIIKGICDWGENKGKKGQALAARNACSLLETLLREPSLRAEDFGMQLSAAETRAERSLREQTRKARFQEVLSKIREAQRRMRDQLDQQARFLLAAASKSADELASQIPMLEAARAALIEEFLNSFNDGAAAYLHGELDRKQFVDTFAAEIREICADESDDIKRRMQPREDSPYAAIWSAFDDLNVKQ